MIETYKIVENISHVLLLRCKPIKQVSMLVTTGNDMRLEKSRVKYDLRKYSF